MTFSLWTHQFKHAAVVHASVPGAIRILADHFKGRNHRSLSVDADSGVLRAERGSLWFSLLLPGPETWCRHAIDVTAANAGSGTVSIEFSITLNVCGFTVGKNAVLEECRDVEQRLFQRFASEE
jgi:hypothetical protein